MFWKTRAKLETRIEREKAKWRSPITDSGSKIELSEVLVFAGVFLFIMALLALAPKVPFVHLLIFGVANGPSTSPIPQLVGHLSTARQQGRRVLGYVYTKMGQRSLAEVLDDIDRYYDWYPVNGIFVDEGDYSCDHVGYYSAIRAHIVAKGADQRVVVNPGRVFEECMMPTADVFMSFETDATSYLNTPTEWVLPSFAEKYPRPRFWHVVHGATPAQLSAIVARSKQLYVGRLWVTHDGADLNPYDSFPEAGFYNTLVQLATESPGSAASARQPSAPVKRTRSRHATDGRR